MKSNSQPHPDSHSPGIHCSPELFCDASHGGVSPFFELVPLHYPLPYNVPTRKSLVPYASFILKTRTLQMANFKCSCNFSRVTEFFIAAELLARSEYQILKVLAVLGIAVLRIDPLR